MTAYAWGPNDPRAAKIFSIKVAPFGVPPPPMASVSHRPSTAVISKSKISKRIPTTPVRNEVQRGLQIYNESAKKFVIASSRILGQEMGQQHASKNAIHSFDSNTRVVYNPDSDCAFIQNIESDDEVFNEVSHEGNSTNDGRLCNSAGGDSHVNSKKFPNEDNALEVYSKDVNLSGESGVGKAEIEIPRIEVQVPKCPLCTCKGSPRDRWLRSPVQREPPRSPSSPRTPTPKCLRSARSVQSVSSINI